MRAGGRGDGFNVRSHALMVYIEEIWISVKTIALNGRFIIVHVSVNQRCRARVVESRATLPVMSTRNFPAERWEKI